METWIDPRAAHPQENDLAVLLIEVAGVRCGILAADVAELHPVVATVPLPGAPGVIDGAIDVRGSVVAVLDLRARLGLGRRPPLVTDHLVVCHVGQQTVALRVDRAVELTSLPPSCIEAADRLDGARYLSGLAKLPDGLVLIHDLASFLSAEEAAALNAALEGLEPGQERRR